MIEAQLPQLSPGRLSRPVPSEVSMAKMPEFTQDQLHRMVKEYLDRGTAYCLHDGTPVSVKPSHT